MALVQKKKGGPYSKDERDKRRSEVSRYSFDYGYTSRKIAELINVNRNTVNADLNYLFDKMIKNTDFYDAEDHIITALEKLKIQKTRLRESLDKEDSFQHRIVTERLMFEIEAKIIHIHMKLVDSEKRAYDNSMKIINRWMKEDGKPDRYMTFHDRMCVSAKSKEKIEKIIEEEGRYGRGR